MALVVFFIREVVRLDNVVGHQVAQGEVGANEPLNWYRRLRNVYQAVTFKIPLLLISEQCRRLLEKSLSPCTIRMLNSELGLYISH